MQLASSQNSGISLCIKSARRVLLHPLYSLWKIQVFYGFLSLLGSDGDVKVLVVWQVLVLGSDSSFFSANHNENIKLSKTEGPKVFRIKYSWCVAGIFAVTNDELYQPVVVVVGLYSVGLILTCDPDSKINHSSQRGSGNCSSIFGLS